MAMLIGVVAAYIGILSFFVFLIVHGAEMLHLRGDYAALMELSAGVCGAVITPIIGIPIIFSTAPT